jgi:hypothetical protein
MTGRELTTQAETQAPAIRIADRIAEIKTNVQMVQHLMRDLMKPEVHYGKIPGTDKPSLFQPGAELICLAFQWATRYVQEDLSYEDVVRYRSTCELYSRATGEFIGTGQGEASSDEEKYRWRKAVHKAEFDAAPEDRRRVKLYKNGGQVQQVRIEPADIANTVLKMANKRALIAATRTASGCSDMFAQDLEDLPDETREAVTGQESVAAPEPLGAKGWKTLVAQAAEFGHPEANVVASAAALGYEGKPADMPRDIAKRLFRAMRDHPATSTEPAPESAPAVSDGDDSPDAPAEPETADSDDGDVPGHDAESYRAANAEQAEGTPTDQIEF